MRQFHDKYQYALVVFDHKGCVLEDLLPAQLEMDLKARLGQAGWSGRCEVIVLDPELEIWIWSNSLHMPNVFGLTSEQMLSVRQKYSLNQLGKPKFPKEAMEECLRLARIPRSSSIYAELAEKVSLKHCADQSFIRFANVLRAWFPQPADGE